MSKQPILLVSPVGEIGGGEKVFLALLNQLSSWDIEPILVCMRPGPFAVLAEKQGIKTYEFKEHRYRQFSLILEGIQWLQQVIRETGATLVHANHASHVYTSPATRLTGIPEVWHIHDYPYHWDWVDRLQRLLPTDYLIFTTNQVKSGYPKLHQRPNQVIPPCCIEPDYLRSIPSQPEIRAKYQLPSGPLMLTVARLQEHKGHRYLIEAMPKVLSRNPDVVFAIVGKPSDPEQEAYQQSLIQRAEALGVQQHIRFLGFVSDADLVSLHREATALVHPAISEGFGLVLLEAMILGTPVIAAAAAGPKELIQDEKTGLLVPTHDSESLANAMLKLLEVESWGDLLSQNAISHVEKFSLDTMVKQTVSIYQNLIEHHKVC